MMTYEKIKSMSCPATGFRQLCITEECPAFRKGTVITRNHVDEDFEERIQTYYCGLGGKPRSDLEGW